MRCVERTACARLLVLLAKSALVFRWPPSPHASISARLHLAKRYSLLLLAEESKLTNVQPQKCKTTAKLLQAKLLQCHQRMAFNNATQMENKPYFLPAIKQIKKSLTCCSMPPSLCVTAASSCSAACNVVADSHTRFGEHMQLCCVLSIPLQHSHQWRKEASLGSKPIGVLRPFRVQLGFLAQGNRRRCMSCEAIT